MFLLLEIIYRGTRFGSVSTVWHALSLSHAILALSAFPYGFSIYRSFRYRKGQVPLVFKLAVFTRRQLRVCYQFGVHSGFSVKM